MAVLTSHTRAWPLLGWRWALRCVCVGSVLVLASLARAHQPAESSADFRWVHGRLELRAVFSLQMAVTLLDDPDFSLIGSQNFEQIKERLTARLTEAFEVTLIESPIKPERVVISLAPEGEIVCSQVYPPASPGRLTVRARFLKKMPDDFYCWARGWFDADQFLGQALLTRTRHSANLPAPAPPAAPSRPDSK